LLEFIAKPTTVLSPISVKSLPLNIDLTLFPAFKLTIALCTAKFLVNI